MHLASGTSGDNTRRSAMLMWGPSEQTGRWGASHCPGSVPVLAAPVRAVIEVCAHSCACGLPQSLM